VTAEGATGSRRRSPASLLRCEVGELAGLEISLTDREITLGRTKNNDVRLHDPRVSRHHAKITPRHGSFMLIDLDSQNGTRVNGKLIKKHELVRGDEIRIGDHRFVYLISDEHAGADSERPPIAVLSDEDRGQTLTLRARLREGSPLTSVVHGTGGHSALLRKLTEHLNALHGMTQIMVANLDRSALLNRICQLLVECFHAERACIAPQDALTGRIDPDVIVHANATGVCDLPLSKTIIETVRNERTCLLCADATTDPRLDQASSVASHQIRSVMCVPLALGDEIVGVLYVDNRSLPNEFTSEDLWLLRAMANQIAVIIENFALLSSLRQRVELLQEQEVDGQPALIGDSPAMQQIVETGQRAAGSNATILLLGESGTGKEVLARSIHRWSERRERQFVVVNCAALAAQLLESDLFGHERGAFTGALRQKKGRLELADRGTLFLDEVGELTPDLQVKLLRFLQEREFERVGGTCPIHVDVRIIAATNRDLAAEARGGSFREDLFYRLRVIEIEMPPLRGRRQDIPVLAAGFLQECMKETGRRFGGISRNARNLLGSYDWPGNVRELRNAIERAVVLADGPWIEASDLNLGLADPIRALDPSITTYHERIRELKRRVIQAALEEAEGVQVVAAQSLGLSPAYLSRLMKRLDMR
jgi:transcriptional regulator with GAF, ATPase, and Fis domain